MVGLIVVGQVNGTR